MKIVYIKDSLGNSAGMERVLCTKANYLADYLNISVYIITKHSIPSDTFFNFSPSVNILGLDLPYSSGNILLRYFSKKKSGNKYKKLLDRKLRELDPDVVVSMFGDEFHFLWKFNNLKCIIAEFHYSRNYLTHLVKGLPGIRYKLLRLAIVKWKQYRERIIATRYDKIVLLTEKDKILWGNKPNLRVIPDPLSFRCERKSELNNKQILAMGRLIAQKGFDLLIDAFTLVAHKNPEWTLSIVGEGQDHVFLHRLIAANKMSSRIFIVKPQKDVKILFLNSSIFALSSRYEGFGLVLTEAMECGVPCVAFDCECGPGEILKNGEDGFLVENGNIQLFAEALDSLMGNKELRREMGRNASVNVTRYYPESVMRKWLSLFSAC